MRALPLVSIAACAHAAVAVPAATGPDLSGYRIVADRIIAAALADDGAYRKLAYLTERIGARLSGTRELERAVAWAVSDLQSDGHEKVRAEPVKVPHWVRGEASAKIIAPVERSIHVLALGGSGSTPGGGLEGEVVVVRDWAAFDALGNGVRGKIVLFNWAMPPYGPKGSGYGEAVRYRGEGPQRAAQRGAIAALVRSATAVSLGTPHTGATQLDQPFPAATLTIEDAELVARLAAAGPVRLQLVLGAHTLPDADSANVVAELVGRERPDEVLVIGGHLDSWDVGQGAHDDGAGCVIMMQALTVLRKLDLRPRRTIRAVLFTNEENGTRGSHAYAEAHPESHVAAIESDSGGFRPEGFSVKGDDAFTARVRAAVQLLSSIGATSVKPGMGGTDIAPLGQRGVPLLGLDVEGSRYFNYHHSPADTLDKVDARELAMNVAAVAVIAYILADQ